MSSSSSISLFGVKSSEKIMSWRKKSFQSTSCTMSTSEELRKFKQANVYKQIEMRDEQVLEEARDNYSTMSSNITNQSNKRQQMGRQSMCRRKYDRKILQKQKPTTQHFNQQFKRHSFNSMHIMLFVVICIAELLVVSVRALDTKDAGGGQQSGATLASFSQQVLATPQQVDARLIPLAASAQQQEQQQQPRQAHLLMPIQQVPERRSSSDQSGGGGGVSSADLPAEYRGAEPAAREQSRLARLCQQTSSVLASVLPAPFGGHKRSILCQFFGQVHVNNINQPARGVVGVADKRPGSGALSMVGNVVATPQSVVSLNNALQSAYLSNQESNNLQQQQQLVAQHANMQQKLAMNNNDAESIAILQQQQQAPIALLATGRDPIKMVLEHQRAREMLARTASPSSASRRQTSHVSRMMDLSAASPSVQQQQQQQPDRERQNKFSAPLVASAGTTLSATSGWRVSESSTTAAPSVASEQRQQATSAPQTGANIKQASSTTSLPAPKVVADGFKAVSSTQKPQPNYQRPKTVLVGGGSGGEQTQINSKRTNGESVRVNASNVKQLAGESAAGVHTIEIVAQSAQANNSSSLSLLPAETKSLVQVVAGAENATNHSTDVRQVQKREELVIASINNLTRIAFGNQLRDTVKVINKLIDQQADLFNSGRAQTTKNSLPNAADPMQAGESVRHTSQVLFAPQPPLLAVAHQKQRGAQSIANELTTKHLHLKEASKSDKKKTTTTTTTSGARTKQIQDQYGNRDDVVAARKKSTSVKHAPDNKRARDQQQSRTNKSGVPKTKSLELKRLSSVVSRSMPSFDDGVTSPKRASTKTTTRNQHKSTTSRGSNRVGAVSTSTTAAQQVGASSAWVPSTRQSSAQTSAPTTRWAHQDLAAASSSVSTRTTATSLPKTSATQYSWLLPDKSVYQTDLFSASSSPPLVQNEKSPKKVSTATTTTTRRMITPYGSDQFSTTSMHSTKKQQLAGHNSPNGLEQRPDSLTTLKMSLSLARKIHHHSTPAPTTIGITTTLPARSTRLPFSTGAQSRWIPSTMFVAPTTKATISSSSSSPSTESPPPVATTTVSTTARPTSATSTSVAVPNHEQQHTHIDDLIEARASESISKYTTHLMSDANELLATTRRQYQQTMPQIANTGDYFSAETISSWPEKYQTMMSQATSEALVTSDDSSSSKGLSFETTRRNGETYDLATGASTNSQIARHKHDDESTVKSSSYADKLTNDERRTTRAMQLATIISNTPNVSILPPNHKLTPSSTLTTTTSMLATDETASEHHSLVPNIQWQATSSTRAIPYTLVEELSSTGTATTTATTATTMTGATATQQTEYPTSVVATHEKRVPPTNLTTSTSESMRPPYVEAYNQGDEHEEDIDAASRWTHQVAQFQLSDPMLVLDANQSKPHVAKKLYELLVPASSSMASHQELIPTKQRSFNWLALKYLVQNILSLPTTSATIGRHLKANESVSLKNETTSEFDDLDNLQEGNDRINNNQQHKLLEQLLARANLPAAQSYYELMNVNTNNNETITPTSGHTNNSTTTTGKGLFERAGNLLGEMKQLEQKRAAALLAALRYQVPGPLVKPWDYLSGNRLHNQNTLASQTLSRLLADRLDENANNREQKHDIWQVYDSEKVLPLHPSHLLNAIKAVLHKQKLVARDELEARLNGFRERAQSFSIDRKATNYNDDNYLNNTTTIERADHFEAAPSLLQSNRSHRMENILDYKLIQNNETNHHENTTTTLFPYKTHPTFFNSLANNSHHNEPMGDFHTIDLSSDHKVFAAKISEENVHQRSNLQDSHKNHSNSSDSLAHSQTQSARDSKRRMVAGKIYTEDNATRSDPAFDCTDRSSGFYPDSESTCQTFYHCSETGHLLTFNCPSQTRFDEKSLKCGPWYQVPCDLGRASRRDRDYRLY